jgi:hypothetical protein
MAKLPVSSAHLELLKATGELDRILDGRGLTFERPVQLGPPPKPPRPFIIPEPDWADEERERKAAERERQRQEREAIVAEELTRIELESAESLGPRPAKPRRKWRP